jgi:hypothetical protein
MSRQPSLIPTTFATAQRPPGLRPDPRPCTRRYAVPIVHEIRRPPAPAASLLGW